MAKPDAAFPRGNQTVWDTTLGWRFPNPRMEELFPLESMGETGENVAERFGVSREEQDEFALRSQQRWAAAQEAGRFADELVEVEGAARDEHPRPDTSAEKLASLKPAFRQGGSVTAGNSSGINDGAAALVIASEERAEALGAEPLPVLIGDRAEANDPERARALAEADLIYFSGGDPAYLVQTLADTPAWTAIHGAHVAGAALAGCSAGAMALAGSTLDFRASRTGPVRWLTGWGVAPGLAVLAHFDRMLRNRSEWVEILVAAAPAGITVVGIDEHTALVSMDDEWKVFGVGGVHVYADGGSRVFVAGDVVPLAARA